MDIASYAWAAGIVDGEGCILMSWHKKKLSYTLKLQVTNTDPKMLSRLKELFGGGIYLASSKTDLSHWKTKWMWVVSSARAISMLKLILPYLVTKREQAEAAITFGGIRRRRGGRSNTFIEENKTLLDSQHALFHKLRALKEIDYGVPMAV